MSALSPMPQDRPDSIEAFCDRLLAGLGSVREGRRSLEQMVGELSDDERAADDNEPSSYEDDTVEVNPALGWAGTRWSHARNYTMRGISALSCGAFSFLLMQTAGVAALPGLVVAAVAIGAAAGWPRRSARPSRPWAFWCSWPTPPCRRRASCRCCRSRSFLPLPCPVGGLPGDAPRQLRARRSPARLRWVA